jgi:carboxyl-terminal processing protease
VSRFRIVWILAVVIAAAMTLRVLGPLPSAQDRDAAATIAAIREQLRERYVTEIDPDLLDRAAVGGMLGALDGHTRYIPPSQLENFVGEIDGNFVGIGVTIRTDEQGRVVVVSPIDNSPALQAGIEAGDIIMSVDGSSVEGFSVDRVAERVRGPAGTSVHVEVARGDDRKAFKVTRQRVEVSPIVGFTRAPDGQWNWWLDQPTGVAYLGVRQFTTGVTSKARSQIQSLIDQGMKALVIDLRDNPGGRLDEAAEFVDLFLDEGVIVSVQGRGVPTNVLRAKSSDTLPRFPIVVLVNRDSASASEILAGALQEHRVATVVGERTYGKGSVQETVPVRGGLLSLTIAHYHLPSGRVLQRKPNSEDWGVTPDIAFESSFDEHLGVLRAWSRREAIVEPLDPSQALRDDAPLRRAREVALAMVLARRTT